MARPAPDPRAVVAVFEAKHYDGLSYSQLVEWTNGHDYEGMSQRWEWEPISRCTAHNWYKQALEWWIAHERLNPDERTASLEIGLDFLGQEGLREYRAGRIDYETFVKTAVKISSELRALRGLGRAANEEIGMTITVSEKGQAAIDEMVARRDARDRGRARKGIG